jgi:tetrahydromethanopterin S-methyltransferase subunit C
MSLIVPAAALYAFVNPMLTALQRPGLVSLFAALNAATIACAAWFATPFGLMALAWTLAARGALAAGLLLPAFSIGHGRSAKPIFSLLIAPLFGLLVARLAGEIVTRAIPASTDPFTALIFAGGTAGVAFSATLLVFARRRTLALIATLLRLFRRAPASTAL